MRQSDQVNQIRAQSSCQSTSSNVAMVFPKSVVAPGSDSCGVLKEDQSLVSGRPEVVGETQSDQNLSLVSPLGDAEYDAHLGLNE